MAAKTRRFAELEGAANRQELPDHARGAQNLPVAAFDGCADMKYNRSNT
jgi:hypothetical protein